jgi:hypothetical protein
VMQTNFFPALMPCKKTMVRLFSVCTVHHATHLFSSSNVFNGNIHSLTNQFYLWERESDFTDSFSEMIDNFLS